VASNAKTLTARKISGVFFIQQNYREVFMGLASTNECSTNECCLKGF
jgi:hypothetical protein